MIFIETEHLILRNYKITDFEDIFKYFSNEDVSKYEDFYPMKDEQVKDIIDEWKEMDNRLVVELKSQNIVIGSIGYWIDDKRHYCIDYDFNPTYGRNGYATEAAKGLICYLFKTLNVNEVYGDCDVQNKLSWQLLERLGFQKIKQFNNQSYKNDKNGKPILINTYLYELKKSDCKFIISN